MKISRHLQNNGQKTVLRRTSARKLEGLREFTILYDDQRSLPLYALCEKTRLISKKGCVSSSNKPKMDDLVENNYLYLF